jgi:hypothetical protein
MLRDLHHNLQGKLLQTPVGKTSAWQTGWLNVAGAGAAELALMMGAAANTLGASPEVSWDVIVQHADDDGAGSVDSATIAAVTDATALLVGANGNVAAPDGSGVVATLDNDGDENKLLRVGYIGPKQYVRLSLVANGTPGSTIFAAVGFTQPLQRPATDAAADINL